MRQSFLAFPLLAAMGAGLTFSAVPVNGDSERLTVRDSGPPVSCIPVRNIRETDIVDDRTIDFEMAGGKVYRNTLTHSCPSLKFEDRFSYRISGSQLCSVDIIRVLEDWGGRLHEGTGCGLGKFQPIERVSATD